MFRIRPTRSPRLGPDRLEHLMERSAERSAERPAERSAEGSDHVQASRPRRARRHGTRLFGFGAALVMLGQCGNGCAPTQVNPAGTPATPGVYTLLPLGAPLPTEEACAAEVRAKPSPETRPLNAAYNNTTWQAHPTFFPRATGNFTGSTDDIIRWAACKWGYDENLLRAQVAKEAWGKMDGLGGWASDPVMCLPGHGIGVDGRPGECPQVAGLMQVSGFYFPDAIDGSLRSTAYNLEIGLATWRNCFDGNETWLNNVNRGRQYSAGDMWGCVGRWFSGRWYTPEANWYMGELQSYMDRRIWESRDYLSDTGPSA